MREAPVDMSLSKLSEVAKDKEALCVVVHGVTKVGHNRVTEQQKMDLYMKDKLYITQWAEWGAG